MTKDKYPGCWIQTGWITGQDASCTDPNANTGGAIWVYVEIFDDSQPPNNCLEGNFGTPTSNASYDARYYGFINGFYRYNAYYQASNSTNIQLLAYGEFKYQKTAEIASAEIYANGTDAQPTPLCPVLGQKASGKWNIVGNTASNSFASQVQLYTGSWVNWTTNTVRTTTTQDAPYTVQGITNFSSWDYSQWKNSGP